MMKLKVELHGDIIKKFNDINSQSEQTINDLLIPINYEISRIKYDFFTSEADNLLKQEHFTNSLKAYLTAVSACPDHGAIAFTLQKINELILNEHTNIHPSDFADIASEIGKTDNDNELLKTQILENLRKRIK